MLEFIFILLPYAIAFAAGYGIREWISRRRRAAAREEWLRKQDEKQQKLNDQMSNLR